MIRLPIRRATLERLRRDDLVHQHVASIACLCDSVTRRCVAGNDDRAIGRLKTVAVRMRPLAVWHLERGDGHEAIAVHDTGRHVMSLSAVARLVRWLATVQSNVDVLCVCGLKVVDHAGRAGWTVHVERY